MLAIARSVWQFGILFSSTVWAASLLILREFVFRPLLHFLLVEYVVADAKKCGPNEVWQRLW
jgi:hypothetical protein